MARTTRQLSCTQSAMVFETQPDSNKTEPNEYTITGRISDNNVRRVILGFESFPSSLRYRKLYSVYLKCYLKTDASYNSITARLAPVSFPSFNWQTVTWNNSHPNDWLYLGAQTLRTSAYQQFAVPSTFWSDLPADTIVGLISRPWALDNPLSGTTVKLDIAQSTYLLVEYDDTSTVPTQISANNKTSGYINPHSAQTFSWGYDWNNEDGYYALGPIAQSSFTFYWRATASGTWNTVSRTTSTQSISIAAETFPVGTIYWKVSGTDSAGQTSETPVYTLSTTDAYSTATPVSPKSEIVDSSEPVVFTWQTNNSNGTTQTGADLQYSEDGGSWSDLSHISGSSKKYTLPANSFEPGRYYWRVRAYNADGTAGAWSSNAVVIFMAAPTVSGISATTAPFSTITWQSSGQQAYKLTLDGKDLGAFFGTDKSYTVKDYLEDGPHTVTISTQNSLGLWSEPVSHTFSVENTPGDSVILTGNFKVDATLTWTTSSSYSDFHIYRDNKKIGATTASQFVDRVALQEHEYFVINILPGGFYTKSNTVKGTMKTCVTLIDTLDDPQGWLELRLSANDPDEQVFSFQRTASLRHFSGASLPVLELSKYEDGSGTYDVAFEDPAAARAFEALKGKVIVLKSRGGNVMIGALLQLQKRVADFFVVYDFTVQRIFWEDYINDANG